MGVGMGKTETTSSVSLWSRDTALEGISMGTSDAGQMESPFANLSGIQRIPLCCRVGKMGYSPPTEVAKMDGSGL